MSGDAEYLEKYSVAPSPSRDYYGLRVRRDEVSTTLDPTVTRVTTLAPFCKDAEVTLFLWKISHGPHPKPLIRSVKFADFKEDKSLQDEIQQIFGKPLLEHARNIALGRRNTLLTLPRSLTRRLTRYLSPRDVVRLSSLSHVANEVFSDNVVWQSLYARRNKSKLCQDEKELGQARGWKQFFRERRMYLPAGEKKGNRVISSGRSDRPASVVSKDYAMNSSKPTRNSASSVAIGSGGRLESAKRRVDITGRTRMLEKQTSGKSNAGGRITSRLEGITKNKPSIEERKKTEGSISNSSINAKTINFGTNIRNKIIENVKISASKGDIKTMQVSSMKDEFTEDRTLARKATSLHNISKKKLGNVRQIKDNDSKAFTTNESVVRPPAKQKNVGKGKIDISKEVNQRKARQSDSKKSNSTNRGKTRDSKIQSTKKGKSTTILSTEEQLLGELSAVSDGRIGLQDLIEESMTKLRSPDGIFGYDFSVLNDFKLVDDADGSKTRLIVNGASNKMESIASGATMATGEENRDEGEAKRVSSLANSARTRQKLTMRGAQKSGKTSVLERFPAPYTPNTAKSSDDVKLMSKVDRIGSATNLIKSTPKAAVNATKSTAPRLPTSGKRGGSIARRSFLDF